MGHWWNYTDRKTEVLGEKPVPAPLYPLQLGHEPAWDQTWAVAVRDQ